MGENLSGDIYVEFPECSPGKEYSKLLEWHWSFTVKSIEHQNTTSEEVFSVEEDKTKENCIKIIYKPLLTNVTNYGYYLVSGTSGEHKNLCVIGRTLEVKVICETSLICFDCNKSPRKTTAINLVNLSKVDTTYQFINDHRNSHIEITPTKGIIKQDESIKISLTCSPTTAGFSYKKLYCLVRFQDPLIFEIHTKFKKSSSSLTFKDFIYTNEVPPKYSNRFEEFIQDVSFKVQEEKRPPIFATDKRYIDFGFKDLSKDMPVPYEAFTVTNNVMVDCLVTWDTDGCKEFKIEPKNYIIKYNDHKVFSASFEPSKPDQMYSAEISAVIKWGTDLEFVIPCHLSIHFMGHTLINRRSGWDQFYTLESSRILLPATVPSFMSACTFFFTNVGKYPMMFKFIPPYKSHFKTKPLQGIVSEGFQIVAVTLLPPSGTLNNFSETWILELNGHIKVKIKFFATAEYPFLQISKDNIIKFPPTSIYCEKCVPVHIINKTRLKIKFRMILNDDKNRSFYDKNDENVIEPLEKYSINMFFKPQFFGKIVSSMFCEMSILWPQIPEIKNKSILIIEGSCSEVSLSARPKHLTFDGLPNNWLHGTFILENQSDCTAYVKLIWYHTFHIENCVSSIKIKPELFILEGETTMQVEIELYSDSVGSERLKVGYILYASEDFEEELHPLENNDLLDISAFCDKPVLKIIDIRLNRTGANFTRLDCWRMLKIQELNNILKNIITRPKTENVFLKVPSFQEGTDEIFIEMLFKNETNYGAELRINYEKICNCECKLVDHGISIQTLEPHCVHESEIYFCTEKEKYLAKEEGIVEMHCCYTSTDRNLFKFSMVISSTDDPMLTGTINLYVERNCFVHDSAYIDFFDKSLDDQVVINLEPVFIGDPCMPIQVIWVYNTSRIEVNYEIKSKKHSANIFRFLNKTGCVGTNAMHPLLIKFTPYQFISYHMTAEFETEERTIKLLIRAEGRSQPCYATHSMSGTLPHCSLFRSSTQIETSVEHFSMKPTLLHSLQKRLLVLKNNTPYKLQFNWAMRQFGALLNISALPVSGELEPYCTTTCQIFIHALSTPSRFNAHITCQILNLTKIAEYKTQSKSYKASFKEFDSSFYFCDGEFKKPPLKIIPIKKALPEYINITLSVQTLSERFLDMVMPNVKDQIKSLNQNEMVFPQENKLILKNDEAEIVIDVLTRIIWEVLHKKIFQRSICQPPKDLYYKDIKNNEKIKKTIIPNNRKILDLLNGYSCNIVSEMFQAPPQWGNEIFMKKFRKTLILKTNIRACRLSNEYYKEILGHGPYRVMSTYCSRNSKNTIYKMSDVMRKRAKLNIYEDDENVETDKYNYLS